MKKNLSLLTGLIIMAGAPYTQAEMPLVFGSTYVSTGANAVLGGDIVANTYFVAGASTAVDGDIQAGTAITLGADSTVGTPGTDIKETDSGTATTLGAAAVVSGNANHGTAFTLGSGASRGSQSSTATLMSYSSGQVDVEQNRYNLLTASNVSDRNVLESTMPSDITLDPFNDGATLSLGAVETYVYNAASLTTGAGITLSLKGAYHFVFNIADMLSLGAGTMIEVDDRVLSVTWNTGGYASVGEQAEMIGTVFAGGYISTGVDSVITGANTPSGDYNGGLFSATSYVTIGESCTVEGASGMAFGPPQ